ncbi:MAG: class C beta-lactamase-related serine hydrolase, partial [Pedobacter sp.]
MKVFKKIFTGVFSLLIIAIIVLFIWKPYLIRVLQYRTPDANTYKIFPQAVVHRSDSVFHFIRAEKSRTDLDTLHVFDAKNQFISFEDYFKNGELNAFLVIRNDTILYEKYLNGYSDSTLATIFSGAKSIISIMIGKALDNGSIKNLDEKITNYIPELKANSAYQQITIKNLLDMKSGLAFQDALGGVTKAFFSDEAKYFYTHDMKAELLKVKLVNKPGTFWQYKSIDPILLAWVLERATGKTTATFFEENIWKNLGTEYNASFGLDHKNGLANTASRFQVTAIDFAKIGRLFLNKGKFN